jgi:hypothetical protein
MGTPREDSGFLLSAGLYGVTFENTAVTTMFKGQSDWSVLLHIALRVKLPPLPCMQDDGPTSYT